jgi:integrase/recombinase XerD
MEIAAITVGDVLDSDGNVKEQAYLKAGQTKGNKSGTIYLSDGVRAEISQYLSMRQYLKEMTEATLLQSAQKGGLTSGSVQNLFKHLFKLVGLDDCSSHSGRRTLLTNCSNAGINIRTIQAIARHSHLNTTARYLSVTDTQIKNAVNLVSF